ncbi:lycopene beta-cyclase CrtY [Sphingosinicella sp. BN140058]|uniref:lycopene beta-cyclase CrtY n=1 Tax=Sphingosinicella sp. BN140058 TaxID=1892855 RepID=UPI001013988B|nr:lycopene beta-cyclase CrtY [Sphingosinicella sp. BN140058]QAY76693.1 lycopene cyclase [Sphingosinicella sp. BN140058]
MAGKRLIIAGGGLSGCLAALALAGRRSDVELLLLEGADRFGGNHTWSYFDADLDAAARPLVEPLRAAYWDSHEIRFPRRRRVLESGYNSVSSERLDAAVRAALPADRFRLGARIAEVAPDAVTLVTGERLEADGVIDARGPSDLSALDLGWQYFLGRELRFARPHGLARPIIMDATVDQRDGYRFVYCLPFSATDMLVEDTYYRLSADFDLAELGIRIDAYVDAQGWGRAETVREEHGVLPVAMGGRVERLWDGPPVARLGLRGGFFHPTTGYSLPDAARNALLLSRQIDLGSAALHAVFRREAERLWGARGFYRLLNRMLFRAAPGPERYRVLEHFYRLDASVVERFYAAQTTLVDKARILSGKPPVRIGKAISALANKEGQTTA